MKFILRNPSCRILVVMLSTIAFACSGQSHEAHIPTNLDEIDNLTVFSGGDSPQGEISFEREISIGDSPEQPIGRMGGFAVDDLGRIYMSDGQQNMLHIFEPHGKYITSVGRRGGGPGEYISPPFPTVKSNQLFVVDHMRSLMTLYSIDDLELVRTISLNPTNTSSFEELTDARINQIMIIDEETFLVRLSTFIPRVPEDAGELKDDKLIYFYLMGDDGRFTKPLKEPVPLYEVTGRAPEQFQFQGPFARVAPNPQLFTKPIVTTSDNGDIYAAMSDHILIRKYSADGDYQSAFYHPYEHLEMSREDAVNAQTTELLTDIVSQNEIPDTWPAMDRMLIDDEGRIWIATVVDNFSVHEWWILEETGELITTFEWPRDETIVVVINSKMYTRETDEDTGLQQVVRYRIELN